MGTSKMELEEEGVSGITSHFPPSFSSSFPPLLHSYVLAAAPPPGRDVTVWCLQMKAVNLSGGSMPRLFQCLRLPARAGSPAGDGESELRFIAAV